MSIRASRRIRIPGMSSHPWRLWRPKVEEDKSLKDYLGIRHSDRTLNPKGITPPQDMYAKEDKDAS